MKRFARSRRQILPRRGFLVTSVSLLAAVAAQACGRGPTGVPGGDPPTAPLATSGPTPARAPAVTATPPPIVPPVSDAATARTLLQGLVYVGVPDPDFPESIRPQRVDLPNLIRETGQPWRLRGRLVEVVNQGVLVDRDRATGRLQGVPMGNAETSSSDGFSFRPRSGGPLPWENEDLAGAENARALEAARFGEVNAYYHADRTLAYLNTLLAKLGEPPLPPLRIVVNAHSSSRLPGYGQNDGDRRSGKLLPFPGGHYRRPTLAFPEAPFRHPVDEMNRTGEVHLGSSNTYIANSRGQTVAVDGRPYAKSASHNPGIVVHEVGHHINSHTADFRANRDRKLNEYSNRKIHMDEGTADYWAAVMLETPDIYNWQRAAEELDDDDNRDLSGPRTTDDFARSGEPHRNGNIWSSALWDVRRALGKQTTDVLVAKTLIQFSKIRADGPDSDDDERARTIELKDELREGLATLLKADEALHRAANRTRLLEIFDRRGVDLTTPDRDFVRR